MTTMSKKMVTILNIVDRNYECFNLFTLHIYILYHINIYRNNKIIIISD